VIFSVAYLFARCLLGCLMVLARREVCRMPNCWCCGTRMRCCAAKSAGSATSRPTGHGSRAVPADTPESMGRGVRRDPGDAARLAPAAGRAQKVFGVSAGALIALQAARTAPAIGQVAAYEPALLMDTSARYTSWVRRFDREMASGRVADALITSLRGFDLAQIPRHRTDRRDNIRVALSLDAARRRRGRSACLAGAVTSPGTTCALDAPAAAGKGIVSTDDTRNCVQG
jgi:pimeloyl-ACP methyl ester carboxylesterase